MYLKALELQGFKSFPEKTLLTFDGDITAIVGPNGSGKSNLSDALRWVMGEQSTRSLRGGKMEDVIFGGTERRKPVGFAQVSLILDNTDGSLPLEESEVMVTRRYYRSGESEYYINRRTVRLRDVTELFLDTGLGRDGYSIISQGRIDEILSVRSTDRREVFESAAGISRYRHRKEEAERKLERTGENLQRIGDKLDELELQVGPLKEQSETARQYLLYRDELRGLEVSLWMDQLDKLRIDSRKVREDCEQAAAQRDDLRNRVDALYQKAAEDAQILQQQALAIEETRGVIAEKEAEQARRAAQAAALETGIRDNEETIARLTREQEEHDGRVVSLDRQCDEQRSRIRGLTEQETENRQAQETLSRQLTDATERRDALAARLEELRRTEEQETAAAAQAGARLSGLDAAGQELTERNAELVRQMDVRQERLAQARGQMAEIEDAMARTAEEQTARQRQRDAAVQAAERCRTEGRKARDQVIDLQMQGERLATRIKLLTDMEREYEGFGKSVHTVMQEVDRGALRGVRGPVGSLIRVQENYTTALEAALGGALQHIVTEREEDAKAAILSLKQKGAGRCTFLPMDAIRGRSLQEKGVDREPGFVAIASELAAFDPEYRDIIENLLGRTVVAENLDAAIAMARRYGHRLRIVTLDGQLLNPGGSMTGGSTRKSGGILSRASELERLRGEKDALAGRRQRAAETLARAQRDLTAAEETLKTAESALQTCAGETARLESLRDHQAALLQEITEDADALQAELTLLEQRAGQSREGAAALQAEIDTHEAAAAEARALLDRESAAAPTLDGAVRTLSEALADLRTAAAALAAEKSSWEAALERLDALRRDFSGDQARRTAAMEELRRRGAEQESRLRQEQDAQQALLQETETLRGTLRRQTEERMETEARRTRTDREAQDLNRELLAMEGECARLEQKREMSDLQENQILDRLMEHYGLSHSAAQSVRMPLESAAKASRRAAELKRQIAALGTPNLGAIEEYQRVSQRYTFFLEQRNDVVKAKEELEEVIAGLAEEMKVVFVREFANISDAFSKVFTDLFGGGQAHLELEDADDVLGCGIEIKAQPPGKTLKTLSLLSGGEKAFVAIALYFAILKVRPTPFCIMDEIDTALDDLNIVRFARYLRGLADKTQFLVITHRRGTMEEADVLYGVTMQEQGVSKMLAVNLGEMSRELGIR